MHRIINILIVTMALALALVPQAMAKDVKFEVSLDKDYVSIGETAQLGLTFQNTQSMPAPDISNIDGVEIRYMGPSTMMTVINGRVSSSITHMYLVKPLRAGTFQFGPFSFNYKGDNYTSGITHLNVDEGQAARPAQAQRPVQQTNIAEEINLSDRMFLVLKVAKSKAYVNELIPVTVKLYVNRLNVRDIQLPTFAQEGFSKAEFKDPKQTREVLGGMTYDVLEFNTSVFATRPGEYNLGPAKIKCNVIVQKRARRPTNVDDFFSGGPDDRFFDDFFNRYETYPMEVKSQDAPLIISQLPSEGKPQDFSGAIGNYQFLYSADPKKLKTGDPLTVTMEINGTGNFNTVLMPQMESAEGFKVYDPSVKTDEHSKVFTQVMIPESMAAAAIPKATFNYFDPNKGVYKTIAQGPIPIQVEKGKEEAPAPVVGPQVSTAEKNPVEEKLTRDIIYIKDKLGRTRRRGSAIYKNRIFAASMALPLIFLVAVFIARKRYERLERDSIYAGRVRAGEIARTAVRTIRKGLKGDQTAFYEAVFNVMQGYLGNRFHIPPSGITYDAVEGKLKPMNVDIEMLRKLKNLFDVCDRARFAGLVVDETKMKDDLLELDEVIKFLERAKL
jgi:hypothetical protein